MHKFSHQRILLTIALVLAGSFIFYETIQLGKSPDLLTETETIQTNQAANISNGNPTRTNSPVRDQEKLCISNISKGIRGFAHPLWLDFKHEIYLQGIRYPVLQLAISTNEPIEGQAILSKKLKQIIQKNNVNVINGMSKKIQREVIGTLIAEGLEGIINKVETGELPEDLLTKTGKELYRILFEISSQSKSLNLLPSEDELITLIGYGLELDVEDYNQATRVGASIEYLELLISLGPSPESQNNLYPTIPLDIAAKAANLKLMEFWFKTDFRYSNKLHGGNYSDTLLLNAINNSQLLEYWEFLLRWKAPLRDPQTASRLLASKRFKLEDWFKQELAKFVQTEALQKILSPNDKLHYDQAVSQIKSINQLIKIKFPAYKNCKKNAENKISKDKSTKQWVADEVDKGATVEDILKQLAEISAEKADQFRSELNLGYYKPLLMPELDNTYNIIDEDMRKVFGFAIMKDWDSLSRLMNSEQLHDRAILELLAGGSSLDVPPLLMKQLLNQIDTIPIESLEKAASTLTTTTIEEMELSTDSLNQLDHMGKNLFYYAAKKNNSTLMKWLVEQNINMDPDPYGTDPLDVVLKWNTHPKSLTTLCEMNFPVKPKHRKKFAEIKLEDADEAAEILANCPALGE